MAHPTRTALAHPPSSVTRAHPRTLELARTHDPAPSLSVCGFREEHGVDEVEVPEDNDAFGVQVGRGEVLAVETACAENEAGVPAGPALACGGFVGGGVEDDVEGGGGIGEGEVVGVEGTGCVVG